MQPVPSEAPKQVAVAADGSVTETEHSIMVKSTGAPASESPTPDAPRTAAMPEIASGISDVEADFGASPAEAEARMRQTVAMQEAAMDASDVELEMPRMDPEPMCELLSGLTVQLNALGQGRSPSLQAAE